MFSQVMVGSNDIERSKRFYDALFGQPVFEEGGVPQQGLGVHGAQAARRAGRLPRERRHSECWLRWLEAGLPSTMLDT